MRLALLALLLGAAPAGYAGADWQEFHHPSLGPGPAVLHDVHISHTRMVIEGTTIACRVRVFHDDLQAALRVEGRDSTLKVSSEDRADRLFERYFGAHVRLESDGRPVRLSVSASGTEQDPASQQVVWYVLEGTLDRPVDRIVMQQGLFFELFRDQQNIVQLLRMPGEERRTLYFTALDPRDQTVQF